MKKALFLIILSVVFVALVFVGIDYLTSETSSDELNSRDAWEGQLLAKRNSKKQGFHKLDKPDEFALFHRGIRTKDGASEPDYPFNYVLNELKKAKMQQASYYAQTKMREANVVTWTERGPANTPGRTRALVVLPGDPTHNTWVIGSVGGGIWKTTNGGTLWIEKTKDLPNIAFTTIAIAESNPNVLYAGTGESDLAGRSGITGNGVFKSTDAGETWIQLAATAKNRDYENINRVIVDPNNENILLVCTHNSIKNEAGIYKSIDGGSTWRNTYLAANRRIQQISATPSNFNVQYAASNGVGALKSIDAGDNWVLSNTGMSPSGRVELAVSPVNTNKIFASTEGSFSGSGSDLYVSDDSGASWSLVDVSFNGSSVDYLGGQGWYDHVVLCSPFDENIVYLGGVSIVQVELGTGVASTGISYNVQQNGTDAFMSFVNFGAAVFGGQLEIGSDANATNVEIRFGSGESQNAHRFTVPDGEGSGVADNNYSYEAYVEVPFEVWDVDNNRQLMVSFRDQQKDGVFNLLEKNTSGAAATHSREYIYINNVDYNATTPDTNITENGGHVFNEMYFFWPVLSSGATWDANSLPTSTLNIVVSNMEVQLATTDIVADVYGNFDGTNGFVTFGEDVHPDQHGMVAIIEDEANKTFRILLSNDGGPFISKTSTNPGVTEGDWNMVGNTYNTGQFYGADKKPGEDAYFGGMQDNGTWQSSIDANAATNYDFRIGGDGFEVLWHSQDPNKLIGGFQFNGFMNSTNGGETFTNATYGLSGYAPFISKLATSKALPDIIYTVTSAGVFKSENFGSNWNLTSITDFWGFSGFLDVEVSRANPYIIWAGSGMNPDDRRIHVSTDQGITFKETSSSTIVSGTITKLASHPTEPNTAFVLFSLSESAKILKTEDLGVTWTDISGFETNTTSSNGFPDVAVYCLHVHADDPSILWAGTDIGIVESVDNGANWHLLDSNMPKVAIWDMKRQDDQVVIATHGRGIWTATFDNSPAELKESPTIAAFGTSPQENLVVVVNTTELFDSIEVYFADLKFKTQYLLDIGDNQITIPNIGFGTKEVKLRSFSGGVPVFSEANPVVHIDLLETAKEATELIKSASNFLLEGMEIKSLENTINLALQSPHNYAVNYMGYALFRQPIIVSGTNSTFNYKDIALVEPSDVGSNFGEDAFNDYVVVEATKDGINWIPIENGYNASAEAKWQTAFNSGVNEFDRALYIDHTIDLQDKFNEGDTLLFRFRMFSNAQNVGWGWCVDDIFIQTEPLGIETATEISNYSIFPIPSNGNFTIDYKLEDNSDIKLEIIGIDGRRIKSYDLGFKSIGNYRFKFENYKFENGVYLFTLKTDTGIKSKRVLISK